MEINTDPISIAVTVLVGVISIIGTWLFQSRRMTNAEKERSKHVVDQTIESVTRVIIHDDYFPSTNEIFSILNSLARRNEVNPEFLPNSDDIYNDIYVDILRNEYIPADEKNKILKKLEEGKGRARREEVKVELDKTESKIKDINSVYEYTYRLIFPLLTGLITMSIMTITIFESKSHISFPEPSESLVMIITMMMTLLVTSFMLVYLRGRMYGRRSSLESKNNHKR